MFTEDFNPAQRLATEVCPRCHAVGLVEIDAETYDAVPITDRHRGGAIVCPSVYCRCPSCDLVAEWPGMCWET